MQIMPTVKTGLDQGHESVGPPEMRIDLSPKFSERVIAAGQFGFAKSSLGSTPKPSEIFPSAVTLAETVALSISPMCRTLRPVRWASSSCVIFLPWRIRRKFTAMTSLRSIP